MSKRNETPIYRAVLFLLVVWLTWLFSVEVDGVNGGVGDGLEDLEDVETYMSKASSPLTMCEIILTCMPCLLFHSDAYDHD